MSIFALNNPPNTLRSKKRIPPVAAVLRAFIDRIEISHVDKKSRTREIAIVYNFIGAFDFTRAIENARNTRKKEQRTA